MSIQFNYAVPLLNFRHSVWSIRLDIQVGHSGWTFRLDIQVGHSGWAFSTGCSVQLFRLVFHLVIQFSIEFGDSVW